MPTRDLLDADEIRQLTTEMGDGASEIFGDLIDALDHDVERSIREMHEALEQGDSKRLRQAAHRLKGSFASLGAVKAASACQELEMIGESGDIAQTSPMIERLEALCRDSIQALRAFLL